MRQIFSAFTCLSMASVVAASLWAPSATAEVKPFPPSFTRQDVTMNGAAQYVRVGGSGPAVLLLHGFGDTGDMWQPLAVELAKTHTVIVPDLRGMGLSDHPSDGYDKASQAIALSKALNDMGITSFDLVTHDIGNMIGYRLAVQYPDKVTKWVVMDAPLPGLGTWEKQLVNPLVWHFNFRGPDVERLVAGRERILLDRFYNDLSADPARIDEQTREHYATLYARPGAIHAAFSGQFGAFAQDAQDNKRIFAEKGKLTMPILAIGGDHSYGSAMKDEILAVAVRVRGAVIVNSGHWIMEEQPQQAIAVIVPFIEGK